jgi:hypothetical protein
MYMKKKHLSRRAVLRGAGIAVGLPLLDAMIPAGTALAQTAAAPKPRMGFVYFPHGAVMDKWTPAAEGRDFELPQILAPLERHRDAMTIVSGLDNKPTEAPPTHAVVPGTWLSCVPARPTHEPHGGITVDQIAALHISQDTPLPSLEVSTEPGGVEGACDRGYGCSYSSTISFRTPTQPLPMEYNPRKLFFKLFGRGASPEERDAIVARQGSILDFVSASASDLRNELGAADRTRVDDYLQSVREIERRAAKMSEQDFSALDLPEVPIGVQNDFPAQQALQFDLTALALEAGLTRVFTLMMAAEVSGQTFNNVGVSDAFHPLSHHGNQQAKMDRLAKVQTYHSEVFANFLDKIAAIDEGEGSMLDHSVIMYGSNMSNSNAHNHFPLPISVFGKGCGQVTGGQHIRYPDHTPLSNLHVTLLHRVGVPIESLGDSTGLIAEV